MTGLDASAAGTATLDRFLAEDFARIGAAALDRCRALAGQRLYLSGATGFFGRSLLALLAHLHARGVEFQATALSRSPERFVAQNPWCAAQHWLEWRRGDAALDWPGDGHYDLLLHAATETRAEAHFDKAEVFDGIVAVTRRALAFAEDHGVRRLLLTGSGAEYGAIAPDAGGGVPDGSALACDPALASSAYGEGKRVSELLAALHAERHGTAIVNTRCFAFVGPGLDLDGHFAIGNFLRDALRRRELRLASAGAAARSYLYSADLAVWLLLLLLEAPAGSTVNVGSDQAVCILDLARRVVDVVAPGLGVHAGPAGAATERHYYVPSVARARALGLDVWTGLDLAIARTAQWHRSGEPT